MRILYVHQAMADLVPVFRRERRLLGYLGLRYDQIESGAALPPEIGADSLVLWSGEDPRLPALSPDCTGLIRSTKTGAFGLAIGRTGHDTRLLISRWDEVEATGGQRVFAGSVSNEERGADEVRWVVERLAAAHSYSYQRELDWDRFERSARRRIAAACNPADHLRAWEWALTRLHDRHTRVLAIGGSSPCRRVHCGIYGRFVRTSHFLVDHVWPHSAAAAAGVVAGMLISGVAGGDWSTYLRHENQYWTSGTRHFRRAIQHFIPWYQPSSTRLELQTDTGAHRVDFGDESYPGFFHWLYDGEPEPVTFGWLGEDRYRLRISYFPPDQGFVDCCEQLLNLVAGHGSLELDLRGNAGGNAETSVRVAEMFLKPGAPLARRRSRRVGGGYTRWTVLRSDSSPVYGGPLTVLMDEFCASSCEMLLGALKANGRGTFVGRRSAGSTGNPRKYVTERGVEFLCSSWQETTPSGEAIEGVGIGR